MATADTAIDELITQASARLDLPVSLLFDSLAARLGEPAWEAQVGSEPVRRGNDARAALLRALAAHK